MGNCVKTVNYERLPWAIDFEQRPYLSNRRFHAIKPYYESALVSPLPKGELAVSSAILEEAIDLEHKLTEFDIINQTKDYRLPALLLRGESVASSNIEHLTASSKKIALASLGSPSSNNAVLIAQNLQTLDYALHRRENELLSIEKLLSMHAILLAGKDYAGKLRDVPVWIGGDNISPHKALFVPPKPSDIESLLQNLCDFCNNSINRPLITAAVAHAQFETIHPFVDGNGRCGRALVHIILQDQHVTNIHALPLSAGLLSRTNEYFESLDAFREGNIEPIIEQFCDASSFALKLAYQLAETLDELMQNWKDTINERKNSNIYRLLPLIVSQPIITTKYVAEHLGIEERSAHYMLERAVSYGILKSNSKLQKQMLYQNDEILLLLDEIAAQKALRRKHYVNS